SEIATLFNKIKGATELQGSDELVAMSQNLASFKSALIGNDSAIASKVTVLKHLTKVKKEFEKAGQYAGDTRK
ncbi:hypothetical protein CWC05_22770, partial [Pseudoalteromonas ruthenica]